MAHISSSIANYNISFFSSFLCLHLESFGVSQAHMGYCFMLLSMPYFIATLSTPIICKKVPRKLQFVICFGISTIAFSLMGPSRILNFPHSIALVLIGMTMLGFIQALCFIQSLPEAIEVFQQKYKIVDGADQKLDNKLNDCMSTIPSLFYNFSSLVGPIFGGFCYETWGYMSTMDGNMFFEFAIFLIFLCFNCGISVFS